MKSSNPFSIYHINMYELTSNMTLLRRTLDMIGGLYNGNIQFLPISKSKNKYYKKPIKPKKKNGNPK